MNDVTVVTSVTYPSPESLALVADVQYHEPYLSAALNRKFRGIVDPGFYAGFLPKPGGGMNLLITSVDGDKTAGTASVDIGEFYQVTIQHRKDISLALKAGKKYAIVLKGRYLLGEDTYQVNTASHIHAAEFVARTYTDSYQLGDGELLVCTVNIPAGVSAITQEMIDTSDRINRTIGIDISDSVTSTRSDVAASSLAVKKAYDLAKSKYTAQDASTTQKGLVQLSSATNSTSEVLAATPKAVKAAYDLANGKYTAQDATTTQKGIVQLSSDTSSTSETLAATPKAVKAAYDLAAGKAPSSHTHPWNQITGVPTASLIAKGITQLSSATNSDSETMAATPKAVKSIKDLADTKAPIESPSLTGTPTAPTAAQGTNSTQIATTAFVHRVFDLIKPGDFFPIGIPVPYPLATPPDNWMVCNGADFSASVYPELAKLYPDLKVPDLRGLFIRGWSHGYTPDSGRTLLSRQESAFAKHKHNIYVYAGLQQPLQSSLTSCDPSDTMLVITTNKGVTTADGVDNNSAQYMTGIGKMNCVSEGKKNNLRTAAAIPTAKMSDGENETRPVNMAFNYILRAK